MRAVGVPGGTRLWLAIGLTFVVALFAVSPVWSAAPARATVDHHVSADGHRDHLATVDHEHIGVAASLSAPDSYFNALTPRVRTALISLGVLFAIALLWRLSQRYTPAVGRDPPRTPVAVSTGQDVLARLCIARR